MLDTIIMLYKKDILAKVNNENINDLAITSEHLKKILLF
jgi:hypothetical protein